MGAKFDAALEVARFELDARRIREPRSVHGESSTLRKWTFFMPARKHTEIRHGNSCDGKCNKSKVHSVSIDFFFFFCRT